jgi:hypothetical protein
MDRAVSVIRATSFPPSLGSTLFLYRLDRTTAPDVTAGRSVRIGMTRSGSPHELQGQRSPSRLGAGRRPSAEEGLDHYAVAMTDPEGNEFDIN